jgi:hypothetical protein
MSRGFPDRRVATSVAGEVVSLSMAARLAGDVRCVDNTVDNNGAQYPFAPLAEAAAAASLCPMIGEATNACPD